MGLQRTEQSRISNKIEGDQLVFIPLRGAKTLFMRHYYITKAPLIKGSPRQERLLEAHFLVRILHLKIIGYRPIGNLPLVGVNASGKARVLSEARERRRFIRQLA